VRLGTRGTTWFGRLAKPTGLPNLQRVRAFGDGYREVPESWRPFVSSPAARRRGESALARISASLIDVDAAGKELSSPEEIAAALGELERVKALMTRRLTAAAPTVAEKDQLLTAQEAAKRLALSPDTPLSKGARSSVHGHATGTSDTFLVTRHRSIPSGPPALVAAPVARDRAALSRGILPAPASVRPGLPTAIPASACPERRRSAVTRARIVLSDLDRLSDRAARTAIRPPGDAFARVEDAVHAPHRPPVASMAEDE
jgi:hypothetical protein